MLISGSLIFSKCVVCDGYFQLRVIELACFIASTYKTFNENVIENLKKKNIKEILLNLKKEQRHRCSFEVSGAGKQQPITKTN